MFDKTMDSIFDIPVSSTPHLNKKRRGRPRKVQEYKGPTIGVVDKPWDSRTQDKPLSEVFKDIIANSPKTTEVRRSGRARQQHVPFDAKKIADKNIKNPDFR